MVIHVQKPKDIRTEFIRVDFTLPCGKSPEWMPARPSIQKFRLVRKKDCDAVLERFMKVESNQAAAVPIWKYIPGEEHQALPFGQVAPCYRSIDLPFAPVV
jgi:hypothetical protein